MTRSHSAMRVPDLRQDLESLSCRVFLPRHYYYFTSADALLVVRISCAPADYEDCANADVATRRENRRFSRNAANPTQRLYSASGISLSLSLCVPVFRRAMHRAYTAGCLTGLSLRVGMIRRRAKPRGRVKQSGIALTLPLSRVATLSAFATLSATLTRQWSERRSDAMDSRQIYDLTRSLMDPSPTESEALCGPVV